ncbi:DegT/DnrJ/EryC1/StrS family aminotransferase [Mongoliitalea daihaiensis]|uniref:DegT/DnrJ/EryC1/StrS family aminotransferase n=1 Tax=Mongoliitalea daihaiensis TaxID=2782006 RepID=UPI001F3B3420|nr:DegT/DnrJ/EryC1/StrS family aminotransferase [Mongoliitalea daihaiensis]UJP64474.1 DegT/DnrJ/EryC1/StrS family aminotransferase [Mongoliitalea daihaiensis]
MAYSIPLFNLNFDELEQQAALETIKSGWISTGPKTAEFETKFASMLNVNHAVALSNCTVALHLAMKLVGIEPGDEVICPSLTFVATCNSIRYVDAIPLFADIESVERPVICPQDIESKITKKTKAIVVMHYAGFPCDMDAIMDIAHKHNLKVIEDACHAPLSEYKGKKLGTIGDVGCFSFFSNKNISTGEGGMLVTNSQEYYNRAKLLRSHGMTSMSYERAKGHATAYDVVDFGYNYRMDDIRASIGLVQLDKIQADLDQRAIVRKEYITQLSSKPDIIIPFKNHSDFTSNYIFPIVLKKTEAEKRDVIRDMLATYGVQTSMHYPAVHRFSVYQKYYLELPKTDQMVNSMITLPMFAALSKENIFNITSLLS